MTRSGQAGVGTTDLPLVNTWLEVPTVSILIDPSDARGPKAVALAAQMLASRDRVHTLRGYRMPSSSDPRRSYVTTATSCQCADFRYRGRDCYHALAAQLLNELADEAAAF